MRKLLSLLLLSLSVLAGAQTRPDIGWNVHNASPNRYEAAIGTTVRVDAKREDVARLGAPWIFGQVYGWQGNTTKQRVILCVDQFSGDWSGFPDFIQSLESVKGRGVIWEIINEPNLRLKPAEYIEILRKARTILGPKERIISGGLSPIGSKRWPNGGLDVAYLAELMRLGLKGIVNGVGVHLYVPDGSEPECVLADVAAVQAITGMPVYQTERGYTGADRVDFLYRSHELIKGKVQGDVLYRWPSGNDADDKYSAAAIDGTPAPWIVELGRRYKVDLAAVR